MRRGLHLWRQEVRVTQTQAEGSGHVQMQLQQSMLAGGAWRGKDSGGQGCLLDGDGASRAEREVLGVTEDAGLFPWMGTAHPLIDAGGNAEVNVRGPGPQGLTFSSRSLPGHLGGGVVHF